MDAFTDADDCALAPLAWLLALPADLVSGLSFTTKPPVDWAVEEELAEEAIEEEFAEEVAEAAVALAASVALDDAAELVDTG